MLANSCVGIFGASRRSATSIFLRSAKWFRPPNSAARLSFRPNTGRGEADLYQGAGGLAVDTKARAIGLRERAGERKRKVGAAGTETGRGCKLAEGLKRGRDFFLAHAQTGITHAQDQLAAIH